MSNIAYRGIKDKDFDNVSFTVDVFSLSQKDFNVFLDSKFNTVDDREMLNMLWQHCIPKSLYDFIKLPENFDFRYVKVTILLKIQMQS